ncbi:MAG: metallophosphoesterase family protein [Bryobacterales bacterium]|nr:metallophosphoesterase family protein [Bryobacterales bacterium]
MAGKSWLSRRRTLLIVFVLALGVAYTASRSSAPKVDPAEAHRPSRLPDRIILTWSGDPATTQSVTWRTSTDVTTATAQIAEAEDGPGFAKKAREIGVTSTPFTSDLGDALYHTAHFTGLTPRTLYAYRVGDGTNWSEWNQFRTASDRPDPLTFIYGGDAQNDVFSFWSRLIRTAYKTAPETHFILHAGDLINRANRDEEWGEWFRAPGWINNSVASLAAPGNHEYDKGPDGRELSRHWRPQFAFPEHGPAGLEESCYSLDIQGVRVVVMNSNEKHEEQAEWLDGVLANNPNRWTVLSFHHPIFSAARNRDNKKLRETWKPVIDKYRVDLVLQGHDHTYARSNLVTGVNTRDTGTVYVVSVMGPKMYRVEREPWMTRIAEQTQLFQVIRVAGDSLRYEARTARGLLYDAFELQKRPNRPNRLIDRVPPAPERVQSE